jgi:PAS domain S-box-containing protein
MLTGGIDSEKASTEFTARYKGIFDATNNGVAVFSATGDGADFFFVDLNKALEKILKIDRDAVIGKSVKEIFPSIQHLGFLDVLQRVWETGKPVDLPMSKYNDGDVSGWRKNYVYKLPTGEIVSLYRDETHENAIKLALRQSYEQLELKSAARVEKLKTANEKLEREIQARKKIEAQLEKADRQWRATFDAVNSAMCVLDISGKVQKANKAMADRLQQPFMKIIGKPFWRLVHGTDRPAEDCPFVKMKKTLKRETVTRLVDRRWIKVTVDPVLDDRGELEGAVNIISDVTARIDAGRSLNKSKANPQPVLSSAVDITRQKEVDRVNRESDRLRGVCQETGAVCHELNQPIMAISGYLELLSMGVSEHPAIIEKVNTQVRRLSEITGKLKDITRCKTITYADHTAVDIKKSRSPYPS